MTGMHRLQLFQAIVAIVGIGIMLTQCLSLIRELRKYKGYSIRTGKHNLYRTYQIILKPWGLTIAFIVVYFGLKWLYLQTYDPSKVIMYDVWPSLYFSIAALCICFQLYALLERVVLKRKLKDEYIDYCFWDIDIKPKMNKPLRLNESKTEQYPMVRWLHITRIGASMILGVFFIAAGIESMSFFRAICSDQIYQATTNEPDVILRYQDILKIELDTEFAERYIVYGNAGQEIYMVDNAILSYVAEQSDMKIQKAE